MFVYPAIETEPKDQMIVYVVAPLQSQVQDEAIPPIREPEKDEAPLVIRCDAELEPPKREILYDVVPLSKDLQEYIYLLCDTYFVPVELIFAVIEVESNFVPWIISSTDDYGLMQLNLCCHDYLKGELGVSDILDPFQNVHCGIYLFSKKLETSKGNLELALLCYNSGDTGGMQAWENGIKSTFYTEKIMGLYESYVERLNGFE